MTGMGDIGRATAVRARDDGVAGFVAAAGRDPSALSPLAGDASNRRYLRLDDGQGRAVVMDAPPDRGEDVRPFLAVTAELLSRGLSAPRVIAADEAAGFLMLEDLGDAVFARVCAERPEDEPRLYAAAVDLLADRLRAPPPMPDDAAFRPYDAAVLDREAALVLEWYLPGATGAGATSDLAGAFRSTLAAALEGVADSRDALVLRDYHAENLLWLPGRPGAAAVGLLDYQDALVGHPAYDLVSLLEDARRDTAPELREAMVARFLDRRPDLDPQGFRLAYAALGAQRNLKIVGIFARLSLRDGKPRYVDLIPRVWSHLERDLAHPALAELRNLVERHLPPPEPRVRARLAAAPDGPVRAAP